MGKEEIIQILKKNRDNIQKGNWDAVYDSIDKQERGEFSAFLLENNIDPSTISTVIDDGSYMESEEGKKKLAELKKLLNEHQFTFEADLSIHPELEPNNLTEDELNYYPPVATDEHITVEYPDKEYVWSNEFNQYIPKVKGYITTKEK